MIRASGVSCADLKKTGMSRALKHRILPENGKLINIFTQGCGNIRQKAGKNMSDMEKIKKLLRKCFLNNIIKDVKRVSN